MRFKGVKAPYCGEVVNEVREARVDAVCGGVELLDPNSLAFGPSDFNRQQTVAWKCIGGFGGGIDVQGVEHTIEAVSVRFQAQADFLGVEAVQKTTKKPPKTSTCSTTSAERWKRSQNGLE